MLFFNNENNVFGKTELRELISIELLDTFEVYKNLLTNIFFPPLKYSIIIYLLIGHPNL